MAINTALRLEDIDLTNLDLFVRGDPHPVWTYLRKNAPIYRHPPGEGGVPFWSVTKYMDARQVYSDPVLFSSEDGINLPRGDQLMRREDAADYGGHGQSLIMTDPPKHTKHRQLVNKRFTPRGVAPNEAHIREIVNDILDEVAPRGECDFVIDVAARLPTAVICEMMGIPRQDWDMMFELGNKLIGAQDPEYQGDADVQRTGLQAAMEMTMYFAKIVEERKRNPGDDLVSALVHGEIDGEKLSDIDLYADCVLFILGGQETTRNATSGGVAAVIERPEERARLLADPSLVPTWVEESLRWTSPITHVRRTATRNTELGGYAIREGDYVVIWIASANRDEDVFPDPFRFDVGRTPNEHLAFTYGEHFCLGSNLARLELRVMFEEVRRRLLPTMELVGPPERLRSNFVSGIKHMPVRFEPSRA
ncbi:MAG TPA: cytochrome P450 [Dehalococcoidia bacterium]|nr:cytochrome P450 [Dehalococcoidia bacterium]